MADKNSININLPPRSDVPRQHHVVPSMQGDNSVITNVPYTCRCAEHNFDILVFQQHCYTDRFIGLVPVADVVIISIIGVNLYPHGHYKANVALAQVPHTVETLIAQVHALVDAIHIECPASFTGD